VPLSPAAKAIIDGMPKLGPHVFHRVRPGTDTRVHENPGAALNAAVLNDLRKARCWGEAAAELDHPTTYGRTARPR